MSRPTPRGTGCTEITDARGPTGGGLDGSRRAASVRDAREDALGVVIAEAGLKSAGSGYVRLRGSR